MKLSRRQIRALKHRGTDSSCASAGQSRHSGVPRMRQKATHFFHAGLSLAAVVRGTARSGVECTSRRMRAVSMLGSRGKGGTESRPCVRASTKEDSLSRRERDARDVVRGRRRRGGACQGVVGVMGACWCACVALSVRQWRPIRRGAWHGLWRRQGRSEPRAAGRAKRPEHPRARRENRSPGRWRRRRRRWGVRLAITGDVAAVPLAELACAWMLLVKVCGGRRARGK